MNTDPDHPILQRPWEWELTEFCYRTNDGAEPHLDLVFEKGEVRKKLRFFSPRDIRISEGFSSTMGLIILDVRGRKLDGLGVQVTNYEAHGGPPEFWAREVEEIPLGTP